MIANGALRGRIPCHQRPMRRDQRAIVSGLRVTHLRLMSSNSSSQFVAIVDDDRSVQSALKDLMESAGLSARCFGSAEEFLESGQREQTACLIADIRMPGMSGLDLQVKLQAEGSRIPIIVITACGDGRMKLQAMQAGAVQFLSKPFNGEGLLESVRGALKG